MTTAQNTQNANQVMAQGMIDISLIGPAGINPNRLYTTKEAAEILATPVRTVSSYLQSGVIPGQKLGPRQWRITGLALLKIMAKGNTGNTP